MFCEVCFSRSLRPLYSVNGLAQWRPLGSCFGWLFSWRPLKALFPCVLASSFTVEKPIAPLILIVFVWNFMVLFFLTPASPLFVPRSLKFHICVEAFFLHLF